MVYAPSEGHHFLPGNRMVTLTGVGDGLCILVDCGPHEDTDSLGWVN